MEKQWLKRIFSAGLALMLAAGLCACGGSAEGESAGGENRGGMSADSGAHAVNDKDSANIPASTNTNTNAKSVLAKENVYRISEVEIPDSGNVGVKSIAHFDGRIYAVMQIYDWRNGHKYYVLSTDESGDVLQKVFLELPGDCEREKTAEPDQNVWEREDTRYSDFVSGSDGRTYALRQYDYSYVNHLTDQSIDEQHEYVCCWDTDGNLLWQLEPCEDSMEDLSVRTIFPAADGSLELLLTGENAYRLSVGRDGSLSGAGKERLSEATAKALRNCWRLIWKEDGSCLLLDRDAEGILSLMKYDIQTDTLGEAGRLPDDSSAAVMRNAVFASGTGSDLIYADRTGVFTCNVGDERAVLKMDYVNSDRDIINISSLLELDDTHFVMFYREDYSYGYGLKAGVFEYVKPEDIPDRTVVILGRVTDGGGIKNRVIQYNRENDRYKVVLKEYESYEDLNLDIISGHMPDILMAEGFPMRSYIAKGLIADVGMLIEGDEELSRADFLGNVFDAYSVDGKLMYVVPSFTLSTMAAKSSLVGDGNGWTMERMKEVLDGMGGNARLLDGLSRSTFMEKVMQYRGNDFIDLETGKCAFDSQEFIEMMKFAYTLPEERSWAEESGEGEYVRQYLKSRTLLLELDIWSFSQYNDDVDERLFYQLNGYLGGDYTFVGFPAGSEEAAENGGGAFICAQNLMALSAVSENMDGAWDFARYYLTDEYQESLKVSLPVSRRIFEEWAVEETMRSYYIDENGEKVEYDLFLESVVPPLDQKQLEQLITYVESVTATPYEDSNVLSIIEEELGSYFSGQKTAEDAAAIIQSRVQMYVQENQ